MNGWQRWVRAPQTLRWRRVLVQIHLWLGIGLGLYVFVICVSGSAVVLRPQFTLWFVPSEVASTAGEPLSGGALEQRVARTYSDYQVVDLVPSTAEDRAVYVVLKRGGEETTRFFDQYAGEDLGSTYPWQVRSMEWLVNLHEDMFLGRLGRKINAVGGAAFLGMIFTGLVLWWPGRAQWRRSLIISRTGPRGLLWQLHSFFGFWTFFFMFAWGVTAVYFAFPGPFEALIDSLDRDLTDFERPDGFLLFLLDLHFGRFGGMWGRVTWMILGLLPAAMFVTGFLLWWRRVVRGKCDDEL